MRARIVEEEGEEDVAAEEHDEDGREVAVGFHNFTIETAGTEEEAAEGLEAALEIQDVEVVDKRPGVRPVGIGETLRRALAKLVMRAAEEQMKMTCRKLQLCAGLEAGIEGQPTP